MAKKESKEKTEQKEKTITPSQYFDYIKGAKNIMTTELLKSSYEAFLKLAEKYHKLGQVESLKKLCFLADTLTKEEKLIELGINTYVYKDTVEDYITSVADSTVKIVELSRYMREVPDELIETIEKVKPIFDELYVVFTDYTGKEERKVEKERRDKDPILFGVFKNNSNVADRFYFIGDWVDEYCDLTLDKMVEQYKDKKGSDILMTSEIPQTSDELVALLKQYKTKTTENSKSFVTLTTSSVTNASNMNIAIDEEVKLPVPTYTKDTNAPKESFFKKIRSVFKK